MLQWEEFSLLPSGQRVHTVCNIAGNAIDSWLRTPYIPRGDANRLYIEIQFTMRQCDQYFEPENLQQCKESFRLMYFEAESDVANEMRPSWDTMTYRHLDVVAADETFVDLNNAVINTEIRDIPVTNNGVYFAFLDEGACVTLTSVRVYYIICPEIVQDFAYFPNTTTSRQEAQVVRTEGVCVDNAVIEEPPQYLCGGNGRWQYMTGRCRCMPGYQPAQTGNDSHCTGKPTCIRERGCVFALPFARITVHTTYTPFIHVCLHIFNSDIRMLKFHFPANVIVFRPCNYDSS